VEVLVRIFVVSWMGLLKYLVSLWLGLSQLCALDTVLARLDHYLGERRKKLKEKAV
jgi:hypothetical protein